MLNSPMRRFIRQRSFDCAAFLATFVLLSYIVLIALADTLYTSWLRLLRVFIHTTPAKDHDDTPADQSV